MMQGNSAFGGFDLQGPLRVHHQQQQALMSHHQHDSHPMQGSSMVQPTFPLRMGCGQDSDQTVLLCDYSKLDRGKCTSDEDEPSLMEDSCDPSKGKKASLWQRVKWTDGTVRLLITAVSYISEDTAAEHGSAPRRKHTNLQKKGKWKSISKVMAERGHYVSPQQCEDKFNDLNKRYKRLNEILGRGTSCEVVENPALLDVMDHISEKTKEEVRKLLSSKHLHYEEMCSYHNTNRLHLPPDPELQHALRLALRSRDDHDDSDAKRHPFGDNNEVGQDTEFYNHGESEENQTLPGDHRAFGMPRSLGKRVKHCQIDENFSFRTSGNTLDCNKSFNFQLENADTDANQVPSEGQNTNTVWMNCRNHQLEEQRIHIEMQMLELEKQRFKWQKFCRKKDRELETMKMEIERMKLENQRMAFELRQKELGINNN